MFFIKHAQIVKKSLQKGLFTRGVLRFLKHQGLSPSNHGDQNCICSFSLAVESGELEYTEMPNYELYIWQRFTGLSFLINVFILFSIAFMHDKKDR